MFSSALVLSFVGKAFAMWGAGFMVGKTIAWIRGIGHAV